MKFKLYGIIILICVVLGSLLFFNKEGFECDADGRRVAMKRDTNNVVGGVKSDYSGYNKIDRIINTSNKYAYCIAGQITCPTNTVPKVLNDDYSRSGKGTTYELLCDDLNGDKTDKQVECSGNYVHRLSNTYKMQNQDIISDELNWKTPTARQINFQFSNLYKGFTVPHQYIPVGINEDNIEFYDKQNNLLDSLHKCEMLNNEVETTDCYFQLEKNKVAEEARKKAEIEEAAEAAKRLVRDKNNSAPKQCIADFGTNLGDKLCCGQEGVLQYDAYNYICPRTAPACSGYVCGEKYGTCGDF